MPPPYTSNNENSGDFPSPEIRTACPEQSIETSSTWQAADCLTVALQWLGQTITVDNMILAMFGPLRFQLQFRDAFLCGVGGAAIGSIPVALASTLVTENEHSIIAYSHHVVGSLPGRTIAVSKIVALLGYLTIDMVISGQILSAIMVSTSFSPAIGIITSAGLVGVVSTIGMDCSDKLRNRVLGAQILFMFILGGLATSHNNKLLPEAIIVSKTPETSVGQHISFFSLCMARAIIYAPIATEVCARLPVRGKKGYIFLQSMIGLLVGLTFSFVIGVSLTKWTAANSTWQYVYDKSPGMWLADILAPIGVIKAVCGVFLSLGVISNMVGTCHDVYCSLKSLHAIPSVVIGPATTLVCIPICAVCAVLGERHLEEIMISFVSLLGCWVAIWFAILLPERLLSRRYLELIDSRTARNEGNRSPLGFAAFAALTFGCAGVVLSMSHTWFIGPVAAFLIPHGADLAVIIAPAVSAVTYPLFRYIESRVVKRDCCG